MRKMNKTRKVFAVVLALTMVFAMTSMAFATNPGDYLAGTAIPPDASNENCSSILVAEPTAATSINVKLVMEAGDAVEDYMPVEGSAFHEEVLVVLTNQTAKSFTISDLLAQVNGIDGFEFKTSNGAPFTSESNYLEQVVFSGTTWAAGQWGLDGWVFRLNDKFPVVETKDGVGYEGTAINETYLKDGDVVHMFYDFPSNFDADTGSVAANYVRGTVDGYTATTLTVQMQGHETYIHPTTFIMSVNNYINLSSGVNAQLYDAAGNLLSTGTTDASGKVSFEGSFEAGQSYVVKSTSTMYVPTEDWVDFISGVYFDLTGAYSEINL